MSLELSFLLFGLLQYFLYQLLFRALRCGLGESATCESLTGHRLYRQQFELWRRWRFAGLHNICTIFHQLMWNKINVLLQQNDCSTFTYNDYATFFATTKSSLSQSSFHKNKTNFFSSKPLTGRLWPTWYGQFRQHASKVCKFIGKFRQHLSKIRKSISFQCGSKQRRAGLYVWSLSHNLSTVPKDRFYLSHIILMMCSNKLASCYYISKQWY